jgi:hypothetical protein
MAQKKGPKRIRAFSVARRERPAPQDFLFCATSATAAELVMSEMITPSTKIPMGTSSSMGIVAILSVEGVGAAPAYGRLE